MRRPADEILDLRIFDPAEADSFQDAVLPLKGSQNSTQAAVAALWRAHGLASGIAESPGRDVGLAESGFQPCVRRFHAVCPHQALRARARAREGFSSTSTRTRTSTKRLAVATTTSKVLRRHQILQRAQGDHPEKMRRW